LSPLTRLQLITAVERLRPTFVDPALKAGKGLLKQLAVTGTASLDPTVNGWATKAIYGAFGDRGAEG
jgi:hypothetical protein